MRAPRRGPNLRRITRHQEPSDALTPRFPPGGGPPAPGPLEILSPPVPRRRALAAACVAAALIVGAAAPHSAAAADPLVLSPAGLRGWHAVHVPAATARADLRVAARRAAVQ